MLRVVRPEGDEVRVATHGGFVQVEQGVDDGRRTRRGTRRGTRVTLLIGVAELAEEIDTDRARAALEARRGAPRRAGGGTGRGLGATEDDEPDADLAEAEGALLRAQARLEAVQSPRPTGAWGHWGHAVGAPTGVIRT